MKTTRKQFSRRIAGIFYLILAATAFYAMYVLKQFETLENGGIQSSALWFDLISQRGAFFASGIISLFLMNLSWLLTAFFLYENYKESQRKMSAILFVSVIMGAGIVFTVAIFQSVPLCLLSLNPKISPTDLALWTERSQFLFLMARKAGAVTNLFYCLWLYPLAVLFLKDKSIAKLMRIILFSVVSLAATGYLGDLILFYFFPAYDSITISDFTCIGEVTALLWMLGRGLRTGENTDIKPAIL